MNTQRPAPSRAALFSLVFVALAASATAVAAQSTNHSQCFKIEDSQVFSGVVDLLGPRFGLTERCRIKLKGRRLCTPVRASVRRLAPGTPTAEIDGETLTFDRICYKVRCDDDTLGPLNVTDPFGTRSVMAGRTRQLCVPAVHDTTVPEPDARLCGNGELDPGEGCEQAADCAAGEVCTACCSCADAQCPDRLGVVSLGGPASISREDFGSSGVDHNRDLMDGARIELPICCTGDGPSACGTCEIRGLDPAAGNCRCADDNRALCDQPFEVDDDDCGGELCHCYAAPPQPRSGGNSPTCIVARLTEPPTGEWDVDGGSGTLEFERRDVLYSGQTIVAPCPSCAGDTLAGDGIRDGVCVLGPDDGLPCDADAAEATFPAPDGGAYSYDCFPNPGKNRSGAGLLRSVNLSTDGKELSASVDCGHPEFAPRLCHCGICAEDATRPCASNDDCFPDGGALCGASGSPLQLPNACARGECSDSGGNRGICEDTAPMLYCDGVTRADGSGLIACNGDDDCAAATLGLDAGNCTITEAAPCFLDTITATGAADTARPLLADVTCTPPTAGAGLNVALGLPGPVRIEQEVAMSPRCATDRGRTYPDCP